MTPQEQQMIDGLIDRVRNTPVQAKDNEAEQHIQQGLAAVPDATYVLVQTVLVQQYGLGQAQAQIDELKAQIGVLQTKLDQAAQASKTSGGSFLSHIFGSGGSSNQDAGQQPRYQPVNNPAGPGNQGYAPAPPPPPYPGQSYPSQSYPGQGYPAQVGGIFGGGGSGGFLQGALQTAAGVAAGEMVFQGMEDLFHGFGRGGGYGRGFEGGGAGETVVNNYYGEDREGDRASGDRNDGGFYNPDHDASRNDSDSANVGGSDIGSFGGDSMNFGGNNDGISDDVSYDNSAVDDLSSSNSDDLGSFDDGAGSDFSDNS